MKKRFTRPDGTEVEVEGTADELAAYERALAQGREPVSEAPSQRRVLNEQVARIAKALEEIREEQSRRALDPWREIYRPVPYPVPSWPWDSNPKITWRVQYPDSYTICDSGDVTFSGCRVKES